MPAAPHASYMICRVGEERLALAVDAVGEVLPLLPVWQPPTLPSPLAGFVQVRGAVLPVLSPATLFGRTDATGPVDAFAHLVRPRGADARVPCLLVDRVESIVSPAPDAVRAIDPGNSHNGAIVAEVALEDGVAHLVSLDRLLDEAERARLEALTREAERRAGEWFAEDPE